MVLLGLLFIIISGCSTQKGNIDQFLKLYPNLKKEADKIDPEVRNNASVPLKFPFTVHEIKLNPELKGFNISIDTRVGENFEHIGILVKSGIANLDESTGQVVKIGEISTMYSEQTSKIKNLEWQDPDKKLYYSMTASPNITKDQMTEIANQIINP
jgi:hypothetical protein